MKIISANEGQKIPYTVMGNWLNIGDQIMLNLEKLNLTGRNTGIFARTRSGVCRRAKGFIMWHRSTFRPASIRKRIDNPDYVPDTDETGESGGMGNSKKIIKRDPVPFSMENVTLTLYALKEGVF